MLVLIFDKDLLVLRQLARQHQLAVHRQPIPLLPAIVIPPRLISVHTQQPRIVRHDIRICANHIRVRMMPQPMLVDPKQSIQAREALVLAS